MEFDVNWLLDAGGLGLAIIVYMDIRKILFDLLDKYQSLLENHQGILTSISSGIDKIDDDIQRLCLDIKERGLS